MYQLINIIFHHTVLPRASIFQWHSSEWIVRFFSGLLGSSLLQNMKFNMNMPSHSRLALASSRSVLEPADIGSAGYGGNFCQLFTEATPVASCYQNLAEQTQYAAAMEGEIKEEQCP